ncbi:hypothetical protein BC939DRAFT_524305 [Gamsiella multidivaricata]|uniref:uncharacterized protein n=1 Tax=Gamsiella multidivaricata TaxID=101098 RepID=UPI00221F19CB|nr:uncharacterized protein BC939DRAFT_524305 [Gamsiella multidivaricata]KAG0354075.1 chitin deacetylase [Gamsiella multidivaricata]KAI7832669.1 hypothetical protein BC939DRAFT_524305 [Gamsiella multidivaricata]
MASPQASTCPFFLRILIYFLGALSSFAIGVTTVYPPFNAVPPTNSSQVKAWLKEIDLSGAPILKLNHGLPPTCPPARRIDPKACYWTCQSCAADDVVICPDRNVWGLTFDDGPTNVTSDLLDFLRQQKLKATFFLIGSNVVQYPHIAKAEVEQGHHIASHTWSHHALTTLTNEEIVAEMKWTERAIEDATGYRVKYMRPPYGDIDSRVRFVLKKLGYVVVDWSGDTFDTQDWRILAKQKTPSQIIATFKQSINTYLNNNVAHRKGFISLDHDLTAHTIEVAKSVIPYGRAHNLTIQSVAKCLHDAMPYAAINGVSVDDSPHPAPGSLGLNAGARSNTCTNSSRNWVAADKAVAHMAAVSSASALRSHVQGQHFLGALLPWRWRLSVEDGDMQLARNILRWLMVLEAVAWWGVVLGMYFVANMASF